MTDTWRSAALYALTPVGLPWLADRAGNRQGPAISIRQRPQDRTDAKDPAPPMMTLRRLRPPRRFRGTRRTLLARAGGVAALCAMGAGCSTPAPIGDTTSSGPLSQTLKEGERPPAPDFSGTTLEGRTVHLSDYRGKVVVVNAWASWCGPCRIEAPELRKIQQRWKDRGVQVLGIDHDNNRADALAFQHDHDLGYPSLHDPSGRQALKLPHGLVNPQSLPFTVVVDEDGKIAAAQMGSVTETALKKAITPLLRKAEKTPAAS